MTMLIGISLSICYNVVGSCQNGEVGFGFASPLCDF